MEQLAGQKREDMNDNNNEEQSLQEQESNNKENLQDSIGEEIILIGNYLKTHREKAGINLQVLSQRTRINLSLLKSLEDNNLQSLPNKTYVKGFVKSYIRELQGDSEEAMIVLEKTFEQLMPKPIQTDQDDSNHPEESFNFVELINKISLKQVKVGAGVILGITVIILVVQQFGKATQKIEKVSNEMKNNMVQAKAPAAPVNEVGKDSTAEPKLANNSNTVEQRPVEQVKATKQEQKVEKIEKVEEKKVEVASSAPIVVDEKNEQNKENSQQMDNSKIKKATFAKEYNFFPMNPVLYKQLPDAPENTDESILPSNVRNSVLEGKQNLFINAVEGDTWLTYKNTEGPIKSFVLKKGRTLLIRGQLIRIFLGNVHVTKIFLNNKLLEISSSNGVKSLVVPQKFAKDYVTPLFVRDTNGQKYTSNEYLEVQKQKTDSSNPL